MCVMDRMCCTGTVPEPPCSCEKKCAEGTKNQDCLRCKDDSSHCMGKEPEPAPVCSCTMKCKEGDVYKRQASRSLRRGASPNLCFPPTKEV